MRRMTITLLSLGVASWASGQDAGVKTAPSSPASSRQRIVVVTGAAGTPEYDAQFTEWADKWRRAAEKGGVDFKLIGAQEKSTSTSTDQTDRDRLKTWIADAANAKSEAMWIVLVGHGTFDGQVAKFNLRGPDVAASELAEWLDGFPAPAVVVNCSSASGPWINALAAKNRIVVTATKSGQEVNFARFGNFLAEAIDDPSADLDKDGQTSLFEAFLTASRGVEEFYKEEGRLASEHALVDDNGDGRGSQASLFAGLRPARNARVSTAIDGLRARQIHLIPSSRETALSADMRKRRNELELEIAKLRDEKEGLREEAYFAQLEKLALELARLYDSEE